jgi:hypothetical protein
MSSNFHFTFKNLEQQYKLALDAGYEVLTCADYVERKDKLPQLVIVNRVDIDMSVKKADRLREIFDRLSIKASFFIRLHASEYNPFSFENYRILKSIRDSGHEIGYHSEIIDQAMIWDEDAAVCLQRDVDILNRMLGIKIKGVASHGGMTGLNNLDFWKYNKACDYDLQYEAYEQTEIFDLFMTSLYISDSEWTRWKCYKNGKLCVDDRRSLDEHLQQEYPLIYLLIHPDTYFDRHIYE